MGCRRAGRRTQAGPRRAGSRGVDLPGALGAVADQLVLGVRLAEQIVDRGVGNTLAGWGQTRGQASQRFGGVDQVRARTSTTLPTPRPQRGISWFTMVTSNSASASSSVRAVARRRSRSASSRCPSWSPGAPVLPGRRLEGRPTAPPASSSCTCRAPGRLISSSAGCPRRAPSRRARAACSSGACRAPPLTRGARPPRPSDRTPRPSRTNSACCPAPPDAVAGWLRAPRLQMSLWSLRLTAALSSRRPRSVRRVRRRGARSRRDVRRTPYGATRPSPRRRDSPDRPRSARARSPGLLRDRPPRRLDLGVRNDPPTRPGEEEGVHFRFVTRRPSTRWPREDELRVGGGPRHGPLRHPAPARRAGAGAGESALLEIDLQGARQVRESMPEALFVFLEAAVLGGTGAPAGRPRYRDLRPSGSAAWRPRGPSWRPKPSSM